MSNDLRNHPKVIAADLALRYADLQVRRLQIAIQNGEFLDAAEKRLTAALEVLDNETPPSDPHTD